MVFDRPYNRFGSAEERNAFLHEYKLRSKKPRKEPVYYYKGRGVRQPTVCEVLGYEREYDGCATLVIDYGEGPCFINTLFLKQMQKKDFDIDRTWEV